MNIPETKELIDASQLTWSDIESFTRAVNHIEKDIESGQNAGLMLSALQYNLKTHQARLAELKAEYKRELLLIIENLD